MSNYTPITDKDISAMLNKLNAKNIDSLFDIIPDKFKYNIDDLDDYKKFEPILKIAESYGNNDYKVIIKWDKITNEGSFFSEC